MSKQNHIPAETSGFHAPGGLLREQIREKIKAVKPYSSVLVEIPEWDITVEVRSMSLGDRDEMAKVMTGPDGKVADPTQFYPNVIAATTHDAAGEKVFSPLDIPWLKSLDAHILDKIAKPAMELNGFAKAEEKVEDAAGKSSATETSD